MAVASVNTAPAVDDDVRPKGANHAHHVRKYSVTPNSLGFFRRFGEAKIRRASEEKLNAVTASCGEQFLGADQSELRRLLWAKIVLAAFAARKSEKRDIGMKAAGKVSEKGGGLVVWMRGDVQNAGRNSRGVDGLDRFRKSGARTGRGRKLGVCSTWQQKQKHADQSWNETRHIPSTMMQNQRFDDPNTPRQPEAANLAS